MHIAWLGKGLEKCLAAPGCCLGPHALQLRDGETPWGADWRACVRVRTRSSSCSHTAATLKKSLHSSEFSLHRPKRVTPKNTTARKYSRAQVSGHDISKRVFKTVTSHPDVGYSSRTEARSTFVSNGAEKWHFPSAVNNEGAIITYH